MLKIRTIILARVLLTSFIAGILWAGFFGNALAALLLVMGAMAIVNFIFWKKEILVLTCILFLLFVGGLARMSWRESQLAQLPAELAGQEVTLWGTVMGIVPNAKGYRVTICLNHDLHDERIPMMEKREIPQVVAEKHERDDSQEYCLSATLPIDTLVQVGNAVELKGILNRPEDFDPSFSWKSYLQYQGIAGVMEHPDVSILSSEVSFFSGMRSFLLQRLQLLFPHISGSLMAGLILGARASFSKIFLEQLQISGLTHIVAVSGFNISLIVAFMAGFVFRRARRSLRQSEKTPQYQENG